MFYCNDCAKEKNLPTTVGNSSGKCEICGETKICNCMSSSVLPNPKEEFNMRKTFLRWGEETEGMGPAEFCAWARKELGLPPLEETNNPNDMYQDRSGDMDPRVNRAINEGPKILKALEHIQDMLKKFHDIKESDRDTIISLGHFYNHSGPGGRVLEQLDPGELRDTFPEYHQEYRDSLLSLNDSVLDAYITFLECEREALIKRWNDMAKDIKPEKK